MDPADPDADSSSPGRMRLGRSPPRRVPQIPVPPARHENGGYRSSIAKCKAIITVAHALLVIIWHVLATGTPYDDLGADYFDRRLDPEREIRRQVAELEALGKTATLETATCPFPPSPRP